MLHLWPELLVLIIVLLFAFRATRAGFVAVLLSLIGFVLALLLAFTFYSPVADWLSRTFSWTPVWSRPIAFIGLWSLVSLVFGGLERLIITRLSFDFHTSPANRALAVLPGILQGLIASAVLLTVLSLAPLQTTMRRDILASPVASTLVTTTLAAERPFEGIFGPAAREALSLIPRRPPTNPGTGTGTGAGEAEKESVDLPFTVDDAEADPANEEAMLELVNRERTSRGLEALVMDPALRELARTYADQMLKQGYFAHNTPEGVDPFERMRQANIPFGLAGENLALAPTLEEAHTGLMNSPGHRENILRDGFRKVGIGVMDGGIYGKMFVQEFTD